MFTEAKVDILNLLGRKYDGSKIKLNMDDKGIVLKVGDKTERFAFRKIKHSQIANKRYLFQSDGLKLVFSSFSQNIEKLLLHSINDTPSSSGTFSTRTLYENKQAFDAHNNTSYSQKRSYDMAQTNDRVSSAPLVKTKPTKVAVRKQNKSPIQDSAPISLTQSKLASIGSPTSIGIAFSSVKPAQNDNVGGIDWYDDFNDPPVVSVQPHSVASVRTKTEYVSAQQFLNSPVASIRKYGTKNTSSGAQVSRTLFPVSTSKASISHTPQGNLSIIHVTTPGESPKKAIFDNLEAATSISSPEAPKWLAALQPAPTTTSKSRQSTPPRYTPADSRAPTASTTSLLQSAVKTVAQGSVRSTSWLSKVFEKAATDAANSRENGSVPGVKVAIMGSSTVQRKRLPGGMRNLGNTCYIAATLQALFSMEIFRSRLSCEFWLSLLALQTPRSGMGVNVVSSGSVSSAPSVLTTPLTAGKSDISTSGGICDDGGTVSAGEVASTVSRQNQKSGSLNKYQQHSVVRELTALIRGKREAELQPSRQPGGGGNGVLDVTRLKRAVSHHTNKYIGYSQQDAHEFLSDLLRLAQEETSERWVAFVSTWQRVNRVSLNAGLNNVGSTEEGSLAAGTCAETQVGAKRARLDDESTSNSGDKHHCKLLLSSANDSDSWLNNRADSVLGLKTTAASVSSTPAVAENTHCNVEGCLPVAQAMKGIVRVQMQCLQCGFQSEPKLEPYEHFSLDLCDDGPLQHTQLNIDSLLENFFAEEIREVCCNQCSSQKIQPQAPAEAGRALAAVRLLRAPRVLILHLKRFRYDPIRQDMVKIHSAVTFPLRLSLQDYMCDTMGTDLNGAAESSAVPIRDNSLTDKFWSSSVESLLVSPCDPSESLSSMCGQQHTQKNQQQDQYALAAVVRHIGASEAAGHYVCDTFIDSTKQWQRCDDSSVYAIDEDTVLQEKGDPYLLFYTAVV